MKNKVTYVGFTLNKFIDFSESRKIIWFSDFFSILFYDFDLFQISWKINGKVQILHMLP